MLVYKTKCGPTLYIFNNWGVSAHLAHLYTVMNGDDLRLRVQPKQQNAEVCLCYNNPRPLIDASTKHSQ